MPLPPAPAGLYRQTYPMRYPDADPTGFVRATSILNALQILAGDHTEDRGFDYRQQRDAGVFWVLSRITARFDSWPQWPGRLTVDTWTRSTRAVFALRDFRFGPEEGPWSGRASSAWVMLKDRKPQRPEPWVAIYEQIRAEEPVAEMPAALPAWDHPEAEVRTVHADWEDVDMNGHVNNVRGIGWCLAQHEFSFLKGWQPATLEANFLAEMFCDQVFEVRRVEVAGEPGQRTFDYAVVRSGDGVVTLRLRVGFRESLLRAVDGSPTST